MEILFEKVLLAIYYLTLGSLAIYGSHRLVLLALYYRNRHRLNPSVAEPTDWPVVTLQLPLFNEMYVASRLIDSVCRLDYPKDRLEIQVLDDSTDETSRLVAERVKHYRSKGFRIHHLHREHRRGFKAGALENGLANANGNLLAVFDADFSPRRDFLKQTVPHFRDPDVGMVQARWEHINRRYSLLTRIQAILLDGHFAIEHAARHSSGRFFNFNGTAGVWRKDAIVDAGGWQHDTLTEDLDLSFRAQLRDWRFIFLPAVAAPAELPVDIHGFKSQQFRWAKGSIQTARKLLDRILRSPIATPVKIEALVHLTSNACYPLMILLSLLMFPAMYLRRDADPRMLLLLDLPIFLGATGAIVLFYVVSQWVVAPNGRRNLGTIPLLMGLGVGLAVNNTRAVFSGLLNDGGEFQRTPKYRIEDRADGWLGKRYRACRTGTVIFEALLAGYMILCFTVACGLGMWFSLPFLYLFLHGYCYMTYLTLRHERVTRSFTDQGTPTMSLATAEDTVAELGS